MTASDGTPVTLRARIAGLMSTQAYRLLVIAMALAACWQIVKVGRTSDDWLHQLFLSPSAQIEGLEPRPWNIFVFADGLPATNHALVDAGIFPWWTDPKAKLAFFRPLSVLFARIDQWCWADYPVMMHLHSLLWFAAALLALSATLDRWVGAYLRTRNPTHRTRPGLAIAGLALWLFALDDARGPCVGWIANRNALISLTLSCSTLWLHARAQSLDAQPWDKRLALGLWALALCAGEASLGALGYLLGFTLWLQPGSWLEKAKSFAPYLVIALLFLALRHTLGYGTYASDIYLDPLSAPLDYLSQAWIRIPMLAASALAGVWSDLSAALHFAFPAYVALIVAACLLLLGAVIYVGWTYWKKEPVAWVMALGLACNLILCASTFPADRTLSLGSIGASSLLAIAIWRGCGQDSSLWSRRGAAWGLLMIHGLVSPALLPARSLSMDFAMRPIARVTESLPQDDDLMDHTLVLINPPTDPQASFFQIYRLAHGQSIPYRYRWLSAGANALSLTRLDEHTLRMVQEDGFLPHMSERMLRSVKRPFTVGEEVELSGMRVTIESITLDGRPAQVRFAFDRPLEDPHFLWARWDGTRFVPYRPPRVGAPDNLAAHDPLAALKPVDAMPPPFTSEAWKSRALQPRMQP